MSQPVARRTFLAGSLSAAAGLASVERTVQGETAATDNAEVYELRVYDMKGGAMRKRADDYFENALLPALGRAGTGSVGVFVESKTPEASPIYVLILHKSIQSVAATPQLLLNDGEYQKVGADFLNASPKDPGYKNLEVRIMLAPDFMPALQVPQKTDSRLFELRRYRNPSEPAFRKKLEMFGKLGEVAIFHRVGLVPVFFGGMLSGPDMPNITYMLSYPDAGAHDTAWKAFGADPDWQKLKQTPGYTDPEIIANIKSIMLKPTSYSQI